MKKLFYMSIIASSFVFATADTNETVSLDNLPSIETIEALEDDGSISLLESTLTVKDIKSLKNGKPFIMLVTSTNCKFCDKQKDILDLDDNVYYEISDHYNFLMVNSSEVDLPEEYYTFSTPSMFFIDKEGNKKGVVNGLQKPDELMDLLKAFLKEV